MAKSTKKETLLNKAVVLGSSLVYLGKGIAEDVISEFEKRNLLAGKEGKELADKLRSDLMDKKDEVRTRVVKELHNIVNQLGIATKEDLKALKKKR